jgi:pimeloyl-ACP methyl ester carboxylesterase
MSDPVTTLPPALPGECSTLKFGEFSLALYSAGPVTDAPPLLFVHSVNAAATAAEWRPAWERLSRTRRVHAFDLPGFGCSSRPDCEYSPRLMTDAVHAVIEALRVREQAPGVHGLALSLGCEFLARAAVEQPASVHSLALVSPTGFNSDRPFDKAEGSTRAVPGVYALVSQRLWAGALFRGLTRPGVVRFFLEKTWGSRAIDETLLDYCVQTARQPGARHAPLHFLSARLFSADISRLYHALTQPVWMVHGTRGDFVDYRYEKHLRNAPNWRFRVFDAGALPQFEHAEAFVDEYDAFLNESPPSAHGARKGSR